MTQCLRQPPSRRSASVGGGNEEPGSIQLPDSSESHIRSLGFILEMAGSLRMVLSPSDSLLGALILQDLCSLGLLHGKPSPHQEAPPADPSHPRD